MAGNDQLILQLLQEVRDEQKNFLQRLDHHEQQLQKHANESETRHKELLGAFPAGDTEGHRRYHETVIEWRELRNKIVRECLINMVKVGGLMAVGWLLYAIWIAMKLELTKG